MQNIIRLTLEVKLYVGNKWLQVRFYGIRFLSSCPAAAEAETVLDFPMRCLTQKMTEGLFSTGGRPDDLLVEDRPVKIKP
ncbi:MAG: hypothetical protein H8E17_15390 [Deltaproteobacteria bacterium]|nr:hypothetical protein [Deltaproteobacteria bacterium]